MRMRKHHPKPHGPVAVSPEDVDLAASRCWQRDAKGYARSSLSGSSTVYLHRVIVGAQPGQIVDHANRDILDCRRQNLRFCTHAENSTNATQYVNAIGYRGVTKWHHRFGVQISSNRRRMFVKGFRTAEDAARAYDRMAMALHGPFAVLNFPPGSAR